MDTRDEVEIPPPPTYFLVNRAEHCQGFFFFYDKESVKFEIYVVGRSGCTDGMQCSRDVENRGKARMHLIAVVNGYIACICS